MGRVEAKGDPGMELTLRMSSDIGVDFLGIEYNRDELLVADDGGAVARRYAGVCGVSSNLCDTPSS